MKLSLKVFLNPLHEHNAATHCILCAMDKQTLTSSMCDCASEVSGCVLSSICNLDLASMYNRLKMTSSQLMRGWMPPVLHS